MNTIGHNYNCNIIFKNYIDDGVIGYDDEISRQKRERIRSHYESWYMPFLSLYEQGSKLTNYQVQLMLHELEKNHEIQRIPKTSIYRGQTLVEKPDVLLKLKNLGIKTVIDLVGYGQTYEEDVKKAGLNYYVYNIYENWWNCLDYSNPVYIDKLVDFLSKMQEEHIYIGCQHGANDTDIALILNDYFNPMLEGKIQTKISPADADFPIKLNTIYDTLKKSHKEKLGWDAQFEQKILKKLTQL